MTRLCLVLDSSDRPDYLNSIIFSLFSLYVATPGFSLRRFWGENRGEEFRWKEGTLL